MNILFYENKKAIAVKNRAKTKNKPMARLGKYFAKFIWKIQVKAQNLAVNVDFGAPIKPWDSVLCVIVKPVEIRHKGTRSPLMLVNLALDPATAKHRKVPV
ncbi:hypothetical protein RRG08_013424 [Elysia crispata]|uniref:Uncharacterized protein n=1 Tax=Elysia crispata TaxID=231223 RepID=A0AAE0ZPM4_9GAST|nr:hypothetical protein RRG08_013424 [Elysia crispata]